MVVCFEREGEENVVGCFGSASIRDRVIAKTLELQSCDWLYPIYVVGNRAIRFNKRLSIHLLSNWQKIALLAVTRGRNSDERE